MADMMLPGGMAPKKAMRRGHGGHAAHAVNLDTKTYIDSKGIPHKYHPGDKAPADGHTQVYKEGHPVMTVAEHKMHGTALYRQMADRAKTKHPDRVMQKAIPQMPGGNVPLVMLPGGRAG